MNILALRSTRIDGRLLNKAGMDISEIRYSG